MGGDHAIIRVRKDSGECQVIKSLDNVLWDKKGVIIMADKIDEISSKSIGSSYAASLGGLQSTAPPSGTEKAAETQAPKDVSSVSKPEKTDEAAGANNLDAIKNSLQANDQGFKQGMDNQVAISGNGSIQGMDPGMKPAGVFMSGKDYAS